MDSLSDSIISLKGDKLAEFRKLRDLMHTASRPVSTAPSSIMFDDSRPDNQSIFHYDIREADSLMGDTSLNLSVQSVPVVCISGSSSRPTTPPSEIVRSNLKQLQEEIAALRSSRSAAAVSGFATMKRSVSTVSQTTPSDDSQQLEQLKSELIPNLEAEISIRDSAIAALDSAYTFLVSKLSNSVLCEFVRVRVGVDPQWSQRLVTGDSHSVDLFKIDADRTCELSLPLSTTTVKVSVKQGELLVFNLKQMQFSIKIGDIVKYKKLIGGLKLMGVPVSLVDLPPGADVKAPEATERTNPRRLLARGE